MATLQTVFAADFGRRKASGFSAVRMTGLVVAAVLHAVAIYVLVNSVVTRAPTAVPVMTTIVAAPETAPPAPPPPVQPKFRPPPPAYVPTPTVRLQRPPPPTAITAVTETPPPPAPAPPAAKVAAAPAPVRVGPGLDLAHSHEPEYPPVSRRLHEQGSLIVRVLVGVDGRPLDVKLVQSCGFPRLDDAAVTGIRNDYRFIPATVDGRPEQAWFTFKFTWKLT